MKEPKGDIINFKANPHFKGHLQKLAERKGLKLGTYIKAMLKKHTNYKEPELL